MILKEILICRIFFTAVWFGFVYLYKLIYTFKMLTSFTVRNFKSFNEKFVFDLSDTNGYSFNKDSVINGVVENAIVYGRNGVGKSNLGLAVFDIIEHLTDFEHGDSEYLHYLNALNNETFATFKYDFVISTCRVSYVYKKNEKRTLIYEKLTIDGNLIAEIDRKKSNEATINLKGAESLNKDIKNLNLSLLKYIKNNSVLDDTDSINNVFLCFLKFIDGMLFFRSLDGNSYLGIETGSKNIQEDIIERGNVKDFETFLNKAGIECKLRVVKESEKNIIAFDFEGKSISFFKIASQGTRALTLFYFWMQRLKEESKVSFLFIDEFDAFYHHELSRLIVEELKKLNIQFVLTTHNTSIMTNDLLRPDCYFVMNKDSVKSLSKSTEKELREAHNLEKMYKAGSFDV
ncbi:ATP-binding protein [Myroides pelagicus]|uniref:AAA family ATPase n=1 Tax=Myroides pelagicus TaxID=270914 RepID=UPI002DBB7BDE|nr:ATP-binding protein [Myroides pelagicus]MEC4114860.1 ATP-binding protein [Myroides pelagicus]